MRTNNFEKRVKNFLREKVREQVKARESKIRMARADKEALREVNAYCGGKK